MAGATGTALGRRGVRAPHGAAAERHRAVVTGDETMSDPNTRIERPGNGHQDEGQDEGMDRGQERERTFPPDRKEGQPGGEPSREQPGRRPDEGQEGGTNDDL